MTAIQICALIVITLLTGLAYWLAYRNGFSTGHSEGFTEGYDVGRDQANKEIRQMEDRCKALDLALAFGPTERMHLQQIAKQLQLSADTFRALKSDQEQHTLYLHKQALTMAALLEPTVQGNAA